MKKPTNKYKIDERNHVELPLLDQLRGLDWEVLDLGLEQKPQDSHRENFAEAVMLPVLREQLMVINPWLELDQVESVVKSLTASFPGTNLLKNNQFVLQLLHEGVSVSENRVTGEQSPSVRYIDYKDVSKNRYIAVCQFKQRIRGTEHHIIPDVVLFLNGLPVAVIECKSPKVKDAIPEAIDQMLRYSEQRGARGEGNASLFYYNQIVVATCRQEAKFGTISTHTEKYFYRWADPYPRKLEELEHGTSSPNDQQRLVAGMFDHKNLLDLIRTFTLFSTNDKGEMIKIVGRYQQFRAVKLAVARLLTGKTPRKCGGIVWHTQGSGKSLTMMFMVREMYRHAKLANWKVIFVTDRTQLEEQLSETSQSIGYTVKIANSINRLKELLRAETSDLVMAMIHKFREKDMEQAFPELNTSPNILVMTDEAHRSQYKMLGANLDKGLPNATKIGYTGTPIDATERWFGDYIDKYTMRQAIDDGVTLEIVYEGRTHTSCVKDADGMDATFKNVFKDYTAEECLEILGYGSKVAYLEADSTVEAKAKDMVAHYLTHVYPNGYKAQIVATSREAAVRYKKHVDDALAEQLAELKTENPEGLNAEQLEQLKQLQTDVIISSGHNDFPHLKAYADAGTHEKSIKSFKLSFGAEDEGVSGSMGILIVNNMLLTGFDAPVEQVMYLDKVVTNHGLLQAIARVNRVGGEAKEKGFVVDYVGIGSDLKKAIDAYEDREQKEVLNALSFPEDEYQDLVASHQAILTLLETNGLTDLTDTDAFYDLFYDEDLRFDYMDAFRKFTRCLNLVYPSKEALNFVSDYNALAAVNVMASKHLRDERLSMKGIPPKLRGITDQYLESKGIDPKIKPISILDDDFEKQVGKRSRTKTKAAEIEHAIRHHLDIDLDDDPDLQASFAEALAQIFKDFQDNWKKIYEELEKLRQRIINASKEETYGLHRKKEMPFFRRFKLEIFGKTPDVDMGFTEQAAAPSQAPFNMSEEDQISLLVSLTKDVTITVERELSLVGFWESIPARKRLEQDLQKILLQPELKKLPVLFKNRRAIISRIMEIAKNNHDAILYSE
ncbi:MAG: restriction endonuclease subunit R [Puniceicoccaceae bacterium]|nr:restriction endonuclease subunit R [Puniceicoccaceae bacterium]